MTTMTTAAVDRDALVERLFAATLGTLELFGVHLGARLGLYRALADAEAGSLSANELADAAGIHPRYAREWLEQQAVAGFIACHGDDAGRRFSLPAPHREVLAQPENLAYVAPFALMVAGIGQALPEVVEAYRTGGGVPWSSYGADARDGQAAINRPAFHHEMARWMDAMPDVRDRLTMGPSRIADLGCGAGWSTIALARTFPSARIDGFDVDPASVTDAGRNVREAGVQDQVRVQVLDAAEGVGDGTYDLVCIFEALHDVARPVETLRAARAMLGAAGTLLVVDERVADTFTAPGDEIERVMYGWSITMCLPASMADQPSAATGTVMRQETLRRYAAEAGFTNVEVLDVENDFFRFYRLR